MTLPTDPYNFTNGATADAEQVDARFSPLYAALNGALEPRNFAAGFGAAQRATLTTAFNLSEGGPADITGMSLTVTPVVASTAIVHGVFDFNFNPTTLDDATALGYLSVDGTAEVDLAAHRYYCEASSQRSRATVAQTWLVPLTAAAHTLKLRAGYTRHSASFAGGITADAYTSLTVFLLP